MNAVAEAKKIVARLAEADRRTEADRWRLAELTHEAVTSGGWTKSAWARELGLAESSVRHYAKVHAQFGDRTKSASAPSFTEAFNIVQGRPAERARGEEAFHALPEDRQAAVIQKAMTKPAVAAKVVADPPTVKRIDTARVERAKANLAAAGMVEREPDPDEVADDALIAVKGAMLALIPAYRRIVDATANLTTEDRENVRGTFATVTRWHELTATLLSGASIDDQLAELLHDH